MMAPLRGDADLVIDTTGLTPHDLRDRVREAFARRPSGGGAADLGGLVRLQVRRPARRRH